MQKYRMSSVLIKLIVINAIVWFVFYLGSFFLQIDEELMKSWFKLPLPAWDFLYKPWTFFTYAFLHSGFWHIFWNMLILYWFGTILLNLFKERTLLTLYFLGGVAGAVMTVLAFNLLPAFAKFTGGGSMQGASASVFAIMVFIATYNPNAEMRVFMFNIKLWQIAAFFVLKDLIQLPVSNNAGGLMAHMGGAIFGYTYAKQLAKGNNIGAGFERIMDALVGYFTPRKKRPFKKVNRNPGRGAARGSSVETKDEKQKKVDAILDKISKSGYESLSKAEKDYLFKAGNDSN